MSYEIWQSIIAKQKLQSLELETVQKIQEELTCLAINRENFITGEPQKPESFSVGRWVVIYRVLHRLRIVEITDIREKR